MIPQTDIERENAYGAFMRGYRDGTSAKVKDGQCTHHPESYIRDSYELGYSCGMSAKYSVATAVREVFGLPPRSILRHTEEVDAI